MAKDVASFITEKASLYKDRVFLKDFGSEREITFRGLREITDRMAMQFVRMGVSKKDRIALLHPNHSDFILCLFSAIKAGGVAVPVNPVYSPSEIAHIINDSGSSILVTTEDLYPKVQQAAGDITCLEKTIVKKHGLPLEQVFAEKTGTPETTALPDCSPDDPAVMFYTSGTTGKPKGVMLTHRNIYANALTTIISFQLTDATTWFHIAPLFHLADAFFIWSVTFQGGSHVMQRQFDPRQVLARIQDEKVTAAMMVPTMINFLLDVPDIGNYDLSRLEWIMVGGAPMSPANAKKMMEKLGCRYVSGYGLTETTPLLTVGYLKNTLEDAPEEKKLNHITRTGLEVVGVDLKVVDLDGNEVPWDNQTIGEIIVRGDNVMKGYWKLPGETEKAIRGGYFYTGDLATVDEEGYVFIVDRAKDIIISGGENVSSVEVENALYTHPDILECAVIAKEDPTWGEVPKAVVSLKSGSKEDEQSLIGYCRERMPKFKVPKEVEFVDELPKTGSGKIRKVELR